MNKSLLAILLMLSASPPWAQLAPPATLEQPQSGLLAGLDVSAERSRIAAERKAVEDRFRQEEAACYQKFAVNACIDESRVVRREQLADLRRQEISINDAERRRKGSEQLRRMEEKEKTEVPPKAMRKQERAKPPGKNLEAPQGDAAEPQPRQPLTPRASPRAQHAPVAKDLQAAQAQSVQEHERYQRKLDEAAAHKAQTEKRNAERTKPAAQPLPPAL